VVGNVGTNWAGNYSYRATTLHEPETLDELRTIVAHAPKIHALGSRHCFNEIADSAELVSLDKIPPVIDIDESAQTVTVSGNVRYGDLALALERARLALPNMASLPHISVAGAIATATHGSGDNNGNLAMPVRALDLVTSEGDVVHVARGDDDFAGMVVGVGALGVVTRLTLDVQPTYQVCQRVYERLPWDALFAHFDEIMASDYSVSLFTDYGETVNEVWRKSKVDPDLPAPERSALFGALAATRNVHPVPRLAYENCTEQLGVPGAWLDRIPHFRRDKVPASGEEIQSEYLVAHEHAVPALQAILDLAPQIRPHLWTTEVRTVAADDLWLSTAYDRPSACLHFSWYREPEAVAQLVPMVEDALAPFAPRPHWGKVFAATAADLAPRYERMDDFRRLAARLDSRGAFRNAFLERHVFG
jgi:xylitol oxidase